jgi:hypothetical protein
MRFFLVTSLALSLSAALACGGSQPAATPPATETDGGGAASNGSSAVPGEAKAAADAGAAAGGEAKKEPDFDDLPGDKKAEVMMKKVVPMVGKVFKEHDGQKYAKFGCSTCHGPGKKKESPSKFLPKLVFKNGGFEKLSKEKPEMVKFMDEKVLPAMAEALGEHPMDKSGKGFGCSGCHSVDK